MPSRPLRISVSFLLILLIVGVIHSDARSTETPEKAQQPEVKLISNPKAPVPPPGQRKKLVFKEELTIGQVEGDDHYMFGDAVFFNTDEKGHFYVTDWDRKRILKYSPEGKYLLTIGSQGQGPGEFQNPSVARFDRNGNIYATDIASRRISIFDRSGVFLRQIPIPDGFGALYMNSRGYFVASQSVRLDSEARLGWKIIYGLFDDKFKLITELYSQESRYKPPAGRDSSSLARFTAEILSRIAFQPVPTYRLENDDLIFCSNPENCSIIVYSPNGQKIRTIQKDYEPSKVTERDKEYFVRLVAEGYLSRGPLARSEEQKKEIIKLIEYPKFKPAFLTFALMENGWLIVAVEIVPDEATLFDLFDEGGRYIGQFKADFPVETEFFFKNGKAYAVAEKDGYKFVKRYAFEIQDY